MAPSEVDEADAFSISMGDKRASKLSRQLDTPEISAKGGPGGGAGAGGAPTYPTTQSLQGALELHALLNQHVPHR